MKNKYGKPVLFIAIVMIILIMNHYFGWSAYLGETENLEFLRQMVQKNIVLAGFVYVGITVIGCVALALPGITFAVFAGLLFGPLLGTILCTVAATLGASLAFLVGRFFLKNSVKPMIEKNGYLKKLLFDETGKNEILLLMITRLVPIFPYNLQNFAYGVTDIRFWPYTVYSFLFMIPGTALFTVGTVGITSRENRGFYLIITAVLAALVFGMGYWLKKKHVAGEAKNVKEDENEQ